MSRYVSVEKYVDMERRGLGTVASPDDNLELLRSIFQKRRTGQNFEQELDQLIYNSLGRIL